MTKQLPKDDHILRYVGGSHIDIDDDTGEPVILGSGFNASPRDKNSPSYNWLDFFDCPLEEQVQNVRNASRLKYGGTALLAKLNVGTTLEHVQQAAENTVDAIHDPLEEDDTFPTPDLSHSLMTNIPTIDEPLGDLIGDLIQECVIETFKAKV